MKRGTLLKRILIISTSITAAAIAVGVKTASYALEPPTPTRTPEGITRDSLTALSILDHHIRYNPYEAHLDSMPPGGRHLQVDRTIVAGREFNDSNYHHLQAGAAIGISPIDTESDILAIDRSIVKLQSSPEYFIDNLTHSLPYLVPEAELLLSDIGRSFRDSLQSRGGGDYRIKVTSILRTNSSVNNLRRRNRNAVGGSAHLYGTTFDISYSNFICNSDSVPRTVEDMKLLLTEILRNFRDAGRCYVKHERKQSCFHITARPIMHCDSLITVPL